MPPPKGGFIEAIQSKVAGKHTSCDMALSCHGITGGWMRVTDLNMTDISQQCPSGLMERNDSPDIHV